MVDYGISFAPKREREESDAAGEPIDDSEFGVEPKEKKSKGKKQVIVSGGLCGFKVRSQGFMARMNVNSFEYGFGA